MKDVIIVILTLIVLIFGFVIFHKDKEVAYEPWPETEPATVTPTTPKPQTDPIACSPSITVSSPAQGVAYTTGQQVTIKWTSCGVGNVSIGLISGGKDFGTTNESPIPASRGEYQLFASNPAKQFTQANTNSYQIVVQSLAGDVVAKSGIFTVTTPAPVIQTLSPAFLQALVDGGKIDQITKFTYNNKIYYSATDFEVVALDGGYEIYNSSGVVVDGCGGMAPIEETPQICRTQNRSQVEVIYTR